MDLEYDRLKSACFDYAKAVMWDRRPTDVSNIQAFADKVYKSALNNVEFIQGQARDPNMLTECVRYLALKHAIPPSRDDIRFFENALEVLVELACPNQIVTAEQRRFFQEIRRGICKAENDAED